MESCRMVEIAISVLRHLTDEERDEVLDAFGTNKQNLTTTNVTDCETDANQTEKPGGEAVTWVNRFGAFYKKAPSGYYDWKTANRAAASFLSRHGPKDRMRLAQWMHDSQSHLVGRVLISDRMFDALWDMMQEAGY